jgi:MYXO-CTERM domain-containing protein
VALGDTPALANGRYPEANALVFSPIDPDLVLLRTTFGVLLSRDGGANWDWLCEGALGIPASSNEDPSLAVTAGGAMVAGLVEGLEVSADTGCDWHLADGTPRRSIKDLAIRPNAPHGIVALASSFGADAGATGGAGYLTQVLESADDGAHWTAVGSALDPSAIPTTIEVAASDPRRLYVSTFRGQGMTRTASLFVSTDGGARWTERPVPIDPNAEAAALIAAVDPTDADRVYVRTQGRSRLLVTGDAGRTYTTALSFTGPMLGFALTADGSKLYAGGPEDGLFVASSAALSFERTSRLPVQCLAVRGADLWACADQSAGFFAGRSTDDGAHFAPAAPLDAVRAPIACSGDATAAQCTGAAFAQLCTTVPGCPAGDPGDPPPIAPYDAGARDGGLVGPRPLVRLPRWSCGCSAAGGGGTAAGLIIAALVAAAATLRRRSRPRATEQGS